MAQAVATAIDERSTLVCEAGTGIGKTFAYLVPALMSGRRVILSTGTKTLQDQLFHRDIPVVRDALKVPVTVALLKGRANYLCIERLQRALTEGTQARATQHALMNIQQWSRRTRSGDVSEVEDVAEDSPVWPQVTSTADNCLGSECRHFDECWVVKARREAQAAEVVVVNHHLFLADATLKESGFGEVLPGADAVVFDEAHQLPETAAVFFGSSLSSRQMNDLARDVVQAQVQEATDTPLLREHATQLEKSVRDLRLALGAGEARAQWSTVNERAGLRQALSELEQCLLTLFAAIEPMAERGPLLANAHKRCAQLLEAYRQFTATDDVEVVRWFEAYLRGFTLNMTPLDIAPLFQQRVGAMPCARIFTSATLAVREDFSYFTRQLGIEHGVERCFESPFNYREQALMYLPALEIDPREAGYTEAVVNAAIPVLNASRGRAFLLFTSHRAMRAAHELLTDQVEFPILVQGEKPRAQLLDQFRQTGNAVLLGTASFWEGVDVRGEALSCVIIDKLPFAAPDDPITQARINALNRSGGNAFRDFQLPEAVIALKQGVGRLIRDIRDRGVLCLCDPRLRRKSYGKVFLKSLPSMRQTDRIEDVVHFFDN